MMKATDFIILMEAERKFKRNEPLNAEDRRVVNRYGLWQPKLCGHKGCTNSSVRVSMASTTKSAASPCAKIAILASSATNLRNSRSGDALSTVAASSTELRHEPEFFS